MIKVTVDERIFPLRVVQMACYTLLDRVESRMVRNEKGELIVELKSKDKEMKGEDLEALFNEELIAAYVSLDRLERNSLLRDYFAKTPFIPTTYNRKAIEEFIEKVKEGREEEGTGEENVSESEGEALAFKLDEQKDIVFVNVPTRRYLLSDVLFGLREVYAIAHAKITGMSKDKIKVELKAKDKGRICLKELRDSFIRGLQGHGEG